MASISDKDRKILWGRSGNQCAICKTPLVLAVDDDQLLSIVGDEAHIIAQGPTGPRSAPLPADQVDAYDNLILLCKIHHKVVDDHPDQYPPDRLRQIKADHEAAIVRATKAAEAVRWRIGVPDSLGPLPAVPLGNGGDIDLVLEGVSAAHIEHDELRGAEEVRTVSRLFDAIASYRDEAAALSVGARIERRHRLTTLLRELEADELYLFGSRHDEATTESQGSVGRLVLKRASQQSASSQADPSTSETDDHGFEMPPVLPMGVTSDEIFSFRLSDAFPGAYGLQIISDPIQAVDRLAVLLRSPLEQLHRDVDGRTYTNNPLWWFRGPINMYIRAFARLEPDKCLIDDMELRIARVASCRFYLTPSVWDFVYVEAFGEPPVGLRDFGPDDIAERLAYRIEHDHGAYVDEEYALWNGRVISVGEAEDGAAIIDGHPHRIRNAQRRSRFLTRFNMILCSDRHVINNEPELDYKVQVLLDGILRETSTVEEFAEFVSKLPKPRRLITID